MIQASIRVWRKLWPPSAIMRLGCANSQKGLNRSLHSPYFDIDEQVLEIGVAIFTEAVVRYLAK